ncbi:hypothetical protein CR513_12985, partial [Mucuna pruriens]
MHFSLHVIRSITCLHLSLTIRFLTQSYTCNTIPTLFLFLSLVAHDSPTSKRAIIFFPQLQQYIVSIDIIFLDMPLLVLFHYYWCNLHHKPSRYPHVVPTIIVAFAPPLLLIAPFINIEASSSTPTTLHLRHLYLRQVKIGLDHINCFKAHLVPFHQLDIKNIIWHGELQEKVYMDQPPSFITSSHFTFLVGFIVLSIWFEVVSSHCIYLVVYVYDIIITCDDTNNIQGLKSHFFSHSLILLYYYFPIKYALDILIKINMLNCPPNDTYMDPNVKLLLSQEEPSKYLGRYRLMSRL